MSFTSDIQKFAEKSGKSVEKIRRGVIIKLFTAIIKDTPVGNPDDWNISEAQKVAIRATGYMGGMLRANWQTTAGLPAEGQISSTDENTAIAKIQTNLGEPEQDVFMVNNLPYVLPVEYDGHSHTKAPAGMVRKNVIRFQKLIREQTSKIS